jgi:hypothetical protein
MVAGSRVGSWAGRYPRWRIGARGLDDGYLCSPPAGAKGSGDEYDYSPAAAASSTSIASCSSGNVGDPRWMTPFTKNLGVLGTPLRAPL